MGLKSSIERVAEFLAPVTATTSLDVAANREHLRSGDPVRMRDGLRFLAEIGPAAHEARLEVESLLEHEDPEISALARQASESIGARAAPKG